MNNKQKIENFIVSIIVPAFKVEAYLSRCIASIMHQRYEAYEVILVDDGSLDTSGSICDELAIIDKRSIIIHQPNGGLSAARNSGLDIACGKYVAFVDSDDWISEDLLYETAPFMEQGYQSVIFGYTMVSSNSALETIPSVIGSISNDNGQKKAEFLLYKLIHYAVGWEAWSRLYDREIIERKQIRFADNQEIFAEDLFFALCYYAHTEHHLSISKSLYYYFQRDDSIMGHEAVRLNANRTNELLKRVYEFYGRSNVSKEIIKIFPILYYFVMKHSVMRFQNDRKYSFEQLQKIVLDDIEDKGFARRQIKQLHKYSDMMLYFYHPRCKAEYMIEQARYFVFGNDFLHFVSRIKQKLLAMMDEKNLNGNN